VDCCDIKSPFQCMEPRLMSKISLVSQAVFRDNTRRSSCRRKFTNSLCFVRQKRKAACYAVLLLPRSSCRKFSFTESYFSVVLRLMTLKSRKQPPVSSAHFLSRETGGVWDATSHSSPDRLKIKVDPHDREIRIGPESRPRSTTAEILEPSS
jgi:hypothetical protein